MDAKTWTAVRDLMHILMLLFLAAAFLFVLTWTNTIKCKAIPGWCDVYYTIAGEPRVAIVFGDEGMGDPDLLQLILADPRKAGIHASLFHIDTVSPGTLKNYKLVIVEKARKISSEKIKRFMDYASTGGRLVWTGDAGTQADPEDFLYKDEASADTNEHTRINAWARKHKGFVVNFNEFLSVDYLGNYCSVKPCSKQNVTCSGSLNFPDSRNPMTFGLISARSMCFVPGADYSLTKLVVANSSTVAATIDYQGSLIGENESYGNNAPIIVTTAKSNFYGSKVGETVAYYAIPPEYLADPSLPDEMRFPTIVEDMYYGMLFG